MKKRCSLIIKKRAEMNLLNIFEDSILDTHLINIQIYVVHQLYADLKCFTCMVQI